jgi:UDP-N-acetylglucosamine 2-epimerase (non-hydrolysing)
MSTIHVISAVGARPNFMKIAPFIRALRAADNAGPVRFVHTLVHTGQHYDPAMSDIFFQTLDIPQPDINLGVGSGSLAEQVGKTMIAFESVLAERKPDWVVVVGDVNATCACSIAAKQQGCRLAHIEAGLRSDDMRMPEEVNRIVTDRLADMLFTPDAFADQRLRAEGVAHDRIHRVGNIMIDTLEACRADAAAMPLDAILPGRLISGQQVLPGAATLDRLPGGFAVLTLHRPTNVDGPATLAGLVGFFARVLAERLPLIWTLHPRARARLADFGLWQTLLDCPRILLVEPLDYREMLRLNLSARVMLTDSGGLQEECCVLGTPCITLRDSTERPVTLEANGGVSRLVGHDAVRLRAALDDMLGKPRRPVRPPLWDGHTAERIVEVLAQTAP